MYVQVKVNTCGDLRRVLQRLEVEVFAYFAAEIYVK